MPQLKIYNRKTIAKRTAPRAGETKLGEQLKFISGLEELEKLDPSFVLFGIPEDIGVRANHGNAGTSNAWNACLDSLLNVQVNHFLDPGKLLLLGEMDCSEEMEKASNLEPSDPNYLVKAGELVGQIDEAVSSLVSRIAASGSVPVIIGGGHNNAYGIIKGLSAATGSAINVLNIDAHTDLRQLEHRHSGNGFSYAREHRFLRKYAIFGLHQNYTPQYIFEEMDASEDILYVLLENMSQPESAPSFAETLKFVSSSKFGLEVDCDAMANFPSSAQSPSGFTLNAVRNMVRLAGKNENCTYLHICEAVATETFPTGKALSYLITDFLKARKL